MKRNIPGSLVWALLMLWGGAGQAQNPDGAYTPADIAAGSRIYAAQCSDLPRSGW